MDDFCSGRIDVPFGVCLSVSLRVTFHFWRILKIAATAIAAQIGM